MIKQVKKEYRKQIDKALELRNSGKSPKAITILSKIFEKIPASDVKAIVVVGLLFKEANELLNALSCFQRAIESDPISVTASIGLFHTLTGLERYDEGFDELVRFFSISESDNHWEILEDMRVGFFGDTVSKSEDPFNLIEKLRDDLHNDPLIADKSEKRIIYQ